MQNEQTYRNVSWELHDLFMVSD